MLVSRAKDVTLYAYRSNRCVVCSSLPVYQFSRASALAAHITIPYAHGFRWVGVRAISMTETTGPFISTIPAVM